MTLLPIHGVVIVAIDRAPRWVFVAIKASKTAASAGAFLDALAKAAPAAPAAHMSSTRSARPWVSSIA